MEEIVRLHKSTYDQLKNVEKTFTEKLETLQKKYDELYKATEQGDKYIYHKYDQLTGDRTYKLYTKDQILQEQFDLVANKVNTVEDQLKYFRSDRDSLTSSLSFIRNENAENMKKRIALETFKERCEKSKLFWLIKLFNNL